MIKIFMDKKNKKQQHESEDALTKPDPETLHKTDPQENMEGPVSSIMQGIKEEAEKNDTEEKPEKKDKK